MTKKYAVRLVLSIAVICFSATAWSQDDVEDGDEETYFEESEEETDLEAELELGDEEDSFETVDLDLSALGEIDPEKELAQVESQTAAIPGTSENDWSERTMDILELHGYFRVRPELYHKFHIRDDNAVYDRPMVIKDETWGLDDRYPGSYDGNDCRDGGSGRRRCKNSTLAGANMRFRLEPTLNISEEVWIKSQIDLLDNVMLGSTPRYWQNWNPYLSAGGPDSDMTEIGRIQGWDMGPPATKDMIVVRRVWGEVLTPFGQLRFGRMGDDWGLGMLHNAGNGLNDDWGNSVDRIMFAFKINDWIIAPALDFPNSGFSANDAAGIPFDVGQLDDAYQLVGIFGYKHDREEQKAMLKRGDWVVNTGLYFSYRWQVLSFEEPESSEDSEDPDADPTYENNFYRRDTWNITPDFWFQFLMGTFHFELELALVYGRLGNASHLGEAHKLELIQFGGIIQIDYGLLSDQLRIGAEFGYASGDGNSEGMRAPATYDQHNPDDNKNDRYRSNEYTVFSFNPAYTVDLILYRHILGSISQSYYFKAWVRYDFLKNALGRNLGVEADVIYSRAAAADSTINNTANLGVEIDIKIMFVTQDRFHAGLAYGVLFPLDGFKGAPY
ncbi:MAG: TIGR04551 family protein, partial [Proteobacteria bacterium]|nr:TIGR04551 family protein [Pseudomonadota bacterium]